MKLVGVCACTSGIAHTYMAKEKLVKAAEALGHQIHIETQGTIGTEDPLTPEEIAEADAVILAVDIKIDKSRFEGKRVMEVPTSLVLKASKQIINKIEESLNA
ncbi:PTS fructose transporter subunit IIB [Enorma phocaeensis]|uniref:PTS fructose transporter subunit IIB n=1 Tax=Enorma phocaeensis TaxID=1871019 RepID=A0ABT7V8K8_9ACTN|nr:PTS fructose transporter subunit IIB [Enorma phocaeensis]MBM6953842.1 PTS fructose transporter subunit IIB [Enorma phocaeensis]MDM8274825.1 PTS fructose transporter subunit IIB [Enorma phocaeensis]